MGDSIFVECPIHLDAVPIQDILVFNCGHGFCAPCLDAHFAHPRQSSHFFVCPTCRQPVKRKDAFCLFLATAQPGSTGSGEAPTADAFYAQLKRQLKEAKAAHAGCLGHFDHLNNEIDKERERGSRQTRLAQFLRERCGLLEEHLAKEEKISARAREDNDRMREEVAKLQVEKHKTSKALEQALREVEEQAERVKWFQGCIEQYKHKCNLEKKKRKAIEGASHHLPHKEDDSLVVVDANAPDTLRQDGPDFGWLDEACRVKGDPLTVASDEDVNMAFDEESGDEAQHINHDTKGKQRVSQSNLERGGTGDSMWHSLHIQEVQISGPPHNFHSDWNLGPEVFAKLSSGITRRWSRRVGGSKIVKVKMPAGTGNHKPVGGPLEVDERGRNKRPIVLGSRQKFNSKN